jgi:D-3-phosphoglycerate dehydrogenase / 2-oxoglutarate reductase
MRLVAYDPYVSPERARQLSVELLDLEQLVAQADFLTLHLPKTPETEGAHRQAELLSPRPSRACASSTWPAAASSTRRRWPGHPQEGRSPAPPRRVRPSRPPSHPLFDLDEVVVTPHLGASTREAQDKAGDTIAEMVQLALAGDFVPFAVNVSAAEASETVRPFLPLAERLGRCSPRWPRASRRSGARATRGRSPATTPGSSRCRCSRASSAGISEEPVTYVNAPQLAEEHGVEVRGHHLCQLHEYVNLVTLRGGDHAIAGTLAACAASPGS